MVDFTHKRYIASDRSYYAIIKKEIHNLAIAKAFNPKRIAELDIIVAEITSNLNKYADGGELLVGYFKEQEYLEIICTDHGPGMTDIARMISDGYSSSSTLGHGLGSIKRFSDHFDIFTLRDWGSILLCRIYRNAPVAAAKQNMIDLKAIVLAKPSESTSGDGYYCKVTDQYTKIILADGLGHGVEANKAMNAAIEAFKTCNLDAPVEIIRYLHDNVRKTRGLVASVVVIDNKKKQISMAGVGNIAVRLVGQNNSKAQLSYNGIIGHNIPNTMNDQIVDVSVYNEIILCSDGIKSRWDITKYAGIAKCDSSILAAAIYKDFARQTDDMSILVVKLK